MIVKILELNENKEVVPSIECYTEPYLKAVLEAYKDPIPALTYLYYMTHPYSAYNYIPKEDRERSILETYPGEYSIEDLVIVKAIDELEKRYTTPQKRYYESQKNLFDVMSKYYSSITVDAINDDAQKGNINVFKKSLQESKKTAESFSALENLYKEETQTRIRGGYERAYDAGKESL